MKPLLVIIGGPTAIGKTGIAVKIARHFKTDIISADSRQFFKEMSIGTAVPTAEDLSLVKHHFIQNISVTENYNASKYENDVMALLPRLFQEKQVIILVGGSGLYIDAVCNGIDDLPPVPQNVRNKFQTLFESEGLGKIQGLLKNTDPEYYNAVDLNNHKRILKALEISEITGKPYSSFLGKKNNERFFNILKIFLDIDRSLLYDRINKRVDMMVASGLENEVSGLQKFKSLTPLNTVGYKEFFEYFDGRISKTDAIEQIKNHSRAYARRQLTWFRRYKDAHWFQPDQVDEIVELISNSIENDN